MSAPPSLPSPDDWRAATGHAVVTDATGLGLIACAGADAAAFLHGQVSNDVRGLAPGQGRWATYNSPKGRMLATLYIWRAPDGPGDRYAALVGEDIAQVVRKRLAIHVLRAKAVVTDETPAMALFGVGGPAAEAAVAALGAAPARGRAAAIDGGTVLRLPDGRCVVAVARDAAERVREALASGARAVGHAVWAWLAVRAGIATVTAATQDLFVAQTANWDALGGLDFQKGCYPGQEIVARTHYLGRLKERMVALAADAPPPAPGTRLYSPTFGEQACGTVVESAPSPQGGAAFLAVVQVDAVGTLALGAVDGAAVRVEPLPYALPEPAAAQGRPRL